MREAGGIIVDGIHVASTHQCGHCGAHFEMVKGSGRIRGWCTKCQKITCGGQSCIVCIPMEARLDILEGNKRTLNRFAGEVEDLQSKGLLIL